MGASQGQILRVFLLQGATLGLIGSLLGSLLAAASIVAWETFLTNPDGTPLFVIGFDAALFLVSAVLATLTGLAAAVAPARRGARLDPVVAIRG
jgi:lipoprotein-releasing system permease protein